MNPCEAAHVGWYQSDPAWWLYTAQDPICKVEQATAIRLSTQLDRGLLDPPLPSPIERRPIREAAGYTQEDLARLLHLSRHTISKWEQPAGYIDGRRLAGREPVGVLRQQYAVLLDRLAVLRKLTPRREMRV